MDAIQVHHMVKQFKENYAVNDISFHVKKGELFGFLGVNGAGKSTTINILCTLYPMNLGSASICGLDLNAQKDKIRKHIGVVFQENSLDDRLSVKENLLYRSYLYSSDSNLIKKRLSNVCELLELSDLLKKRYKKLSGGQKRRCEIARALLHQPEILFLDEPTTGLDPKTRSLVWDQISYLKNELGMTIFLTTHNMEEAAKAEHIVVIDHGKIVADASPFTLKEKYSFDKLRLHTNETATVLEIVNTFGFRANIDTNCITVQLPNTLASIPLLQALENHIQAYEVLQGTMEDAFLTLTNNTNNEYKNGGYNENSSNVNETKYETLF